MMVRHLSGILSKFVSVDECTVECLLRISNELQRSGYAVEGTGTAKKMKNFAAKCAVVEDVFGD